MIIDIATARERLQHLDLRIAQKQQDIEALVKMPDTNRTFNVTGLNEQLDSLDGKINDANDYLYKCRTLSETINSGISSLELRKKRAADTLHMFTDILEVRGSVKMVRDSLNSAVKGDSKQQLEQLETATYFMQKSMSLMQVIAAQMPADNATFKKDQDGVEGLREQVGNLLKKKIVEAINQDEVAVIKKIACLFKSVDKQDEGMRHYTNYVL
jgi:uncharacterized coiled-coil protein SlyX